MNFTGSNLNSCGCSKDTCPKAAPTYQQCNQVVQTCNVEDVPHYTNYHTHVVNNCVKRHINIPTYSTTSENVLINEYVEGQPVYQEPVYQQPILGQQPMTGMYQGQQAPYNQGQFINPGMYPNTGYPGNLPDGMTPNGYNPNMMPGGFNPFGM